MKLPARLQPLRLPLVGDFAAQDSLIAERTLEAGTPYIMDIDDAEIYRCVLLADARQDIVYKTLRAALCQGAGVVHVWAHNMSSSNRRTYRPTIADTA